MPLRKKLERFIQSKYSPIIILLGINLLLGLFTLQDYGLSLDEPLFYSYADAIGYAYSPTEWFSGEFDLTDAYGASPGDHANRGPAYLLIARIPAHLLQNLGMDMASSWHLVNFLVFQVGLYFFYIFCLRWMKPWPALGATAFMSTQPILWEHAFINPKDPPFLVFFLITLELGFRMAERLANPDPNETKLRNRSGGSNGFSRLNLTATGVATTKQNLKHILLPAIALGLTTNIRVLGPLAAVLAGIYFLTLRKPGRLWWFIPYGLIAYAVMVFTWPYLWEAPFGNFIRVVQFMADNPTTLQVYFYGDLYPADSLPLRYLPAMMFFTLTEPVWFLSGLGFITATIRTVRKRVHWQTLLPTLGWFAIPFTYVLLRQPPMYDGFRHFLFIVPPLFVLTGIALNAAFGWIKRTWLQAAIILLLLLPGITPGIRLHPYQYTYYNQFVGGTGAAALRFETDYWLTCYKEAVEQLTPYAEKPLNLFVKREFYIAGYYAPENIQVFDYRRKTIQADDFVLEHSRANPALQRFKDSRLFFLRVERDGAIFCEIQRY